MYLYGLIAVVIALDQWSKWVIKTSFNLYQSKPIIQDYIHFTYVTNDGMAFGLSLPGGQFTLTTLSIIMTFILLPYYMKMNFQELEAIRPLEVLMKSLYG